MLAREMRALLHEDPRAHPAWSSFKKTMRDRQYGRDPLNQAWAFFREGWEACAR